MLYLCFYLLGADYIFLPTVNGIDLIHVTALHHWNGGMEYKFKPLFLRYRRQPLTIQTLLLKKGSWLRGTCILSFEKSIDMKQKYSLDGNKQCCFFSRCLPNFLARNFKGLYKIFLKKCLPILWKKKARHIMTSSSQSES